MKKREKTFAQVAEETYGVPDYEVKKDFLQFLIIIPGAPGVIGLIFAVVTTMAGGDIQSARSNAMTGMSIGLGIVFLIEIATALPHIRTIFHYLFRNPKVSSNSVKPT